MNLFEAFKIAYEVPTESNGTVQISLASGIPRVERNGSKSVRVTVKPNIAPKPLGGYIFDDTDVIKIIDKAIETQSQVLLRFETRRKKGQPLDVPLSTLKPNMEIAAKNVNNALVGVYDFNNEKWILSSNYAKPENDPEELTNFIKEVREKGEDVNVDDFFTEKVKSENGTVTNTITFDKQKALLEMYYFIKKEETKNNIDLGEETRRDLSEKLIQVSNKIQQLITNSKEVDYKDFSHEKARYLVISYIKEIEPLNDNAIIDINSYRNRIYKHSKGLVTWSGNENIED